MAVIGDSVPARRPFFRPQKIPALIVEASDVVAEDVFVYALAGGWPGANSAIRLIAGVLSVVAMFSFAFVASVAREKVTRLVFAVVLAATAIAALAAVVADSVVLRKTAAECNARECVTAVPESVLNSENTCRCSPDGWFYSTLGVDVVLMLAATSCLALTIVPAFKKRRLDPTSR